MKTQIIIFFVLITFSTTNSADWWDGWEKIMGKENYIDNYSANKSILNHVKGRVYHYVSTDTSVDFSINFKAKGNLNHYVYGYKNMPLYYSWTQFFYPVKKVTSTQKVPNFGEVQRQMEEKKNNQ